MTLISFDMECMISVTSCIASLRMSPEGGGYAVSDDNDVVFLDNVDGQQHFNLAWSLPNTEQSV
jgi:hypothetical protein